MRVTAHVFILAKVQKPWVDSNGTERTSYSANITQSNGEIIDTIRLSIEQFNDIEPNKAYTITANYGIGKNGGYLRLLDITPAKSNI